MNKFIAKNYAANSLGMGIRFLEQIAMVPLFIALWGVDKYADWILITAFSSFFTMADMGLNRASTNEFVIRYQQKKYDVCAKLLINTFVYIIVVGSIFVLSAILIACTNGFNGLLHVAVFPEYETSFAFILLLFGVFIRMYNGAYHGVFMAVSRFHISIMINNVVQLSEVLILAAGVLCKINITIILVVYIVPVFISTVYKHVYIQKWFKLRFSVKSVDLLLLKSLLKPSFAFMLLPLGWAISTQGTIFVVNVLLGSTVLVTFTTMNTIVNFLRSLMNLLSIAIWPEISVAYGKKDTATIAALYHRSFVVTGVLMALCSILLIFLGKPLYLLWTRHALLFNPVFFHGMLAVLFVSCLWGIASTILLATNNHISFNIVFFAAQAAKTGIVFVALTVYPSLAVIPVGLISIELFLLWFVIRKANQLSNNAGSFGYFGNKILHECVFLIRYAERKYHHIFTKKIKINSTDECIKKVGLAKTSCKVCKSTGKCK
jgi:O-antigen/teichoic acid export membrane protein